MIFFKDAVIVLKTNKTSTTLVDEFKQAYNATLNQITFKNIPMTNVDHRILYETIDTANTNITVDGITSFYSENNWHKHSQQKQVPDFCTLYDTSNQPFLQADKPVIVIHVKQDKNSRVPNTNLNDLLHLCLSILVRLGHETIHVTPIKQVIITVYVYSLDYKKFKIVVDGQTIYDGAQRNTLGHRLHLLQKDWRDLEQRILDIFKKSAQETESLQAVLLQVRNLLSRDPTDVIYDGNKDELDHIRDHVLDELCYETRSLEHEVEMCEEEINKNQ